ncbi:hypothetical protein GCM10027072_29400 [Streptomyces bullii]
MKVQMGMPLVQPEPVTGCRECGQLAREREEARMAGDVSRVSDCNVRIRRHPHKPDRRS